MARLPPLQKLELLMRSPESHLLTELKSCEGKVLLYTLRTFKARHELQLSKAAIKAGPKPTTYQINSSFRTTNISERACCFLEMDFIDFYLSRP